MADVATLLVKNHESLSQNIRIKMYRSGLVSEEQCIGFISGETLSVLALKVSDLLSVSCKKVFGPSLNRDC